MCVHISMIGENQCVFVLLSAPLWLRRGYLTTASCSKDQVWKQILWLQPVVPAAVGSSVSDHLNLPHFNLASTPLLFSNRSLAPIPECLAPFPSPFFSGSPSAQRSVWSLGRARQTWPRARNKTREREKSINDLQFLSKQLNKTTTMEKICCAVCCCS